ncbi:MAG: dTDP-4-dehydrorhamnose reductase [Patescibacteria group bacterium]
MIKILIIGAKGMLGQDLAMVFEKENPILFDREDIDIADRRQVFEKLMDINPDIIINSAAYNAVDAAEEDFSIAQAVNVAGPANLAEAAQNLGAVFVHYGSDYVFDGQKKSGYREHDVPNPISAYGMSKYLGEEQVKNKAAKFYIIRPSRLFGRPASSEGAKKSFVDVMLKLASEKDKLDVVDDERSNPTYSPDLAERTRFILENKYPYGIYHAANGGACTWYEFANEIFKQSGVKIRLNPVPASKFPRPAARPAYSSLKNTKLPAMRNWREALDDYLSIISK